MSTVTLPGRWVDASGKLLLGYKGLFTGCPIPWRGVASSFDFDTETAGRLPRDSRICSLMYGGQMDILASYLATRIHPSIGFAVHGESLGCTAASHEVQPLFVQGGKP